MSTCISYWYLISLRILNEFFKFLFTGWQCSLCFMCLWTVVRLCAIWRCCQWHYWENLGVRLRDFRHADVLAGQSKFWGVPGSVQGCCARVSNDGDWVVCWTVHCDGDTRQGCGENVSWVHWTCRSGMNLTRQDVISHDIIEMLCCKLLYLW